MILGVEQSGARPWPVAPFLISIRHPQLRLTMDHIAIDDTERWFNRFGCSDIPARKAFLYAFELLELNGVDLSRELWDERRKVLVRLLRRPADGIRLSKHLDGADGEIVFKHACALGLEGIVAKRRDRPYRFGRSPDWIKVKNPDAPAAMRIIEW